MIGVNNSANVSKTCPLSGSFKKRKRKSIIVTGMLLVVSVLILVFGLAATTRTQNITVGGYYPGVIVSARLEPRSQFPQSRHGLPSHAAIRWNLRF